MKLLCHSVPVPVFGPFVRGDERNSTPTGKAAQAVPGLFSNRYRAVTLRRQEKTPRPARMQIRGFGDYFDAAAAMRCNISSSAAVTSGATGVRP